ncbi:MAG: hypothetical protein FWH18_08335 [Marinilabiliaceae bacterium]|nr:hypothetical protein [Marinilabiliaceae bacterium]
METIEHRETVVDDVLAQRSIEDIKKSYPDEWIVLGNPIRRNEQEMDILSGVVLYHSPDKRELAYRDKPLLKEYKKTTHFFNRVTPRPKRAVLGSIYSTPLK